MKIIIFPFHDIRKNQKEGFRNRDSHFIEEIEKIPEVESLLIINRPITPIELLYKQISWKTNGTLVLSGKNYRVVKTSDKTYVLDYLSYDVIGVLALRKAWFWKAYETKSFIDTIHATILNLQFNNYNILCQSIFSYGAVSNLNPIKVIFDADDNWLRFPFFSHLSNKVDQSYAAFAKLAFHWITNSDENKNFFEKQFSLRSIETIKNGVDKLKFEKEYECPTDLSTIPRPIVGFGGSISHLLDTALLKLLFNTHQNISFVFIGPIIDINIFNSIKKNKNFYYLGDKHYSLYPAYIKNFDICFIPYHTGDKTHGGDAIKFYEFWAAGKKVVATNGNGVYKANDNIFITNNNEEFCVAIKDALDAPFMPILIPEEITWSYKAKLLLSKFK